jgi:hypothetical protein
VYIYRERETDREISLSTYITVSQHSLKETHVIIAALWLELFAVGPKVSQKVMDSYFYRAGWWVPPPPPTEPAGTIEFHHLSDLKRDVSSETLTLLLSISELIE